jgi:hypothetical protein
MWLYRCNDTIWYCVYDIWYEKYDIEWGLGSRTPLFTNIRFTNRFSEQKTFRMTNGFSDYEHASWQQRQADSISAGVSCWLALAQYTSLLDFGLRTFRFTNGLQERFKFENRGPTVYDIWYDTIYLTAIGLALGGSSTVHINTHAVHRTTQWDRIHRNKLT